jgi:hypothetical protein
MSIWQVFPFTKIPGGPMTPPPLDDDMYGIAEVSYKGSPDFSTPVWEWYKTCEAHGPDDPWYLYPFPVCTYEGNGIIQASAFEPPYEHWQQNIGYCSQDEAGQNPSNDLQWVFRMIYDGDVLGPSLDYELHLNITHLAGDITALGIAPNYRIYMLPAYDPFEQEPNPSEFTWNGITRLGWSHQDVVFTPYSTQEIVTNLNDTFYYPWATYEDRFLVFNIANIWKIQNANGQWRINDIYIHPPTGDDVHLWYYAP